MPKEYRTIQEVAGPLMLVRGVEDVAFDELGEIELADGETRRCRVLEIDGSNALVQLFESSTGINLSNSKVRFLGRSMELGVSGDMLGRVFDGLGRPIDDGPEILPEERRDINGLPMNPAAAYQKLHTILKNAELPRIRFHDLRHTFATHATKGGVDPKTLSGILGHTNASFTLDTYTHVTGDMQKNAAAIVGGMVKKLKLEDE